MRNFIAVPGFFLAAWGPELLSLIAGLVPIVALDYPGMPLSEGLVVLGIGLLCVLMVHLACELPVLRTTAGTRRTVRDACAQAADAVADWAGWTTDPDRE